MKKRQLLFLGCFFAFFPMTIAQTIGQFTMWNQNHYLVNPAAAGNKDYFDAAIGFRQQWAGIKNAPRTIYASGHSVLNKPQTHQRSAIRMSNSNKGISRKRKNFSKPMLKHAIGGSISTHEQGAFNRTEAMLSYALHLPISRDLSLSFGLSGGLNSFGFDQSRASVLRDGDPVYDAYVGGENSNQLNVNAGSYLYSDLFFVGYSANQLLQNELEIADIEVDGSTANLEIQHFFIAGYHFDLTNDFRLTPNLLIKISKSSPLFYDIGVNLTYKQEFFVGINYRSDQVISASLGMQANHFLKFGYAYDYTTSELSGAASGSHELFIGLTVF